MSEKRKRRRKLAHMLKIIFIRTAKIFIDNVKI